MENSVLDALLCPICGLEFAQLLRGANILSCVDGHSFDIARQGYVNLLTGPGTKFVEDSAKMVGARDDFLANGHYQGLADALSDVVSRTIFAPTDSSSLHRPLIVDAGTGTGWYLRQILLALGGGVDAIGLDISKYALRRAARRNPSAANLVWDIWRELPIVAHQADVVVVVFAPRNAAEFARVLKPTGRLVVVTPRPGHLAQVAKLAHMLDIQPEKHAALATSLADHFELVDSSTVTLELALSPTDVCNVALMGPAGHHIDSAELSHSVEGLAELTNVSAEFTISIFRKVVHKAALPQRRILTHRPAV